MFIGSYDSSKYITDKKEIKKILSDNDGLDIIRKGRGEFLQSQASSRTIPMKLVKTTFEEMVQDKTLDGEKLAAIAKYLKELELAKNPRKLREDGGAKIKASNLWEKHFSGAYSRVKTFAAAEKALSTEESRVNRALECAKQDGRGTAKRIKNFGIEDEESLIKIALECAKQDGRGTAIFIQNFGIKKEEDRAKIALECAKQNGFAVAFYFQNFKIKKQEDRVKISLECGKQDGFNTARYFQNFKIKKEEDRANIALNFARQNALGTAKYIQNFGLKEENRVKVALSCAKQNGKFTATYIENFRIKKEDDKVKIALECAKQNGGGTAENIHRFWIKDEESRFKIALECANQNVGDTALNFYMFGIKEEERRVKFALECAKKDGYSTASSIRYFNIKNDQARHKIFIECLKQNEKSLLTFDLNSLPPKNKLAQLLLKNAEMKERRESLTVVARNFVKELPCSDVSKTIIEKKIDEISKLKPHTQDRAALWLLHSLFLMNEAEATTLDWMLGNGLWSELGDLRRPELRGRLTQTLFDLASSKENIERDEFISLMGKKKQPRLMLLAIPLFGIQNLDTCIKTLSELKINKKAPLSNVHHQITLLEAAHLLSTSNMLTPEQKSSGIQRIFSVEKDDQRKMINNATAAKGLLQLKNSKWIDSESDLGTLFKECFERLIPLRGFEGNAAQKYDEIFANCRNPDGLITYAAGLKTLNRPKVMECLGQFVSHVFSGTFKTFRYDINTHPHLAKISESHPNILEMWKGDFQVNPKNWVSTKLMDDNHLEDADLSYLKQHLDATSDEERKGAFSKLIKEFNEKKQGKNKKEIEEDPLCVNLKLQMELIKLAKGGETADLASFKKEFLEIQRLLNLTKYGESEFAHDVEGILEKLEKSEEKSTTKEDFKVFVTDDPVDWMLCGTDVPGSGQRLDGIPGLNVGLLGYMMDGKNRLLVIKNSEGKIAARTLLSLLWDGDNPVLYRERLYPDTISAKESEALNRLAKQIAEKLNVPLTAKEGKGGAYGKSLHALGGPAPYEYSDACKGITVNGRYTITGANLFP